MSFVISLNLHRGHLTAGQKAAIADQIANIKVGSNQHGAELNNSSSATTLDEAAKQVHVGRDTVRRFRFVKEHAPEEAKKVREGKSTLNAAHTEAQRRQRKPQERAAPRTGPNAIMHAHVTPREKAPIIQDMEDLMAKIPNARNRVRFELVTQEIIAALRVEFADKYKAEAREIMKDVEKEKAFVRKWREERPAVRVEELAKSLPYGLPPIGEAREMPPRDGVP